MTSRRPVLLYYHPSMEDLAHSISSLCAAAYLDQQQQADAGIAAIANSANTSAVLSTSSSTASGTTGPSPAAAGNNATASLGDDGERRTSSTVTPTKTTVVAPTGLTVVVHPAGMPDSASVSHSASSEDLLSLDPSSSSASASGGASNAAAESAGSSTTGTAETPAPPKPPRRTRHAPDTARESDLARWRLLRVKNGGGIGRSLELRSNLRWGVFEDGFPNLFIDDVKEMYGRDVLFLASFHSPAVIFEQLSAIYAFPRYLARSFTLILPYFPTGTMERVDIEGQVVTAKSLATLLSAIPLTPQGPPQIVIFDIHALQERFYFGDNVIPRLESAIPLLLDRLKLLPDHDLITIAFPDEGAHKRFHTMFENYPTIICTKVRDGNNRIVTIKEGDADGRHVVIVDDLVKTGGTLLQCAKAIKARGATQISFYVTHAVFPLESWKRFVGGDFAYFWFTDSVPTVVEQLVQHKPFELLSLSTAVVNALLSYDLHQY
ncbi:ribose-phosphate pyrophosphokinase 3 [Capsaspora owczarzaki ATCC 30864]|uniref:Ribose-phosphate pyrophosphokinase 3 n=1 Tax=Capsaspora owczarzaki (strain ATCC 30864) TaxID=595528 RepID=A0A0D2VJ86_CAPO3|nr:ribose-phosphate pyrophosphokinase 3 [Capsaspora owczarzaki ATCC 30864]KJE90032.1 ribose-phosphate pyrophosphokinase 3 [Capsaspora owczarzaki ATCC 30864]|eukprot:XP_004349932.1 ribose-phosphate pyrophosphokinase 3 [Capsaspora owczarzaki ATCC 30864]